jgi:two-component system response regulator RegX3
MTRVFDTEGWAVSVGPSSGVTERLHEIDPDLVLFHNLSIHAVTRTCEAVHAERRIPVIAVSASLRENDVVGGLHAGVDAFVPDSIGDRELIARARALLRRVVRRSTATTGAQDVLLAPPIALDRASRLVTADGRSVAMPRREFDILELLMRSAPRTVTRAVLLRELWDTSPDSQTLDVQVRRLRARLTEASGGVQLIVTVRGVGYRFAAPSESVPPGAGAPDEIDLREQRPGGESDVRDDAVVVGPTFRTA